MNNENKWLRNNKVDLYVNSRKGNKNFQQDHLHVDEFKKIKIKQELHKSCTKTYRKTITAIFSGTNSYNSNVTEYMTLCHFEALY